VAAMILVNTPGSWAHVYPPLLHANWHGLTPTDLVFPFFLFAVGMSISLAFKNYQPHERGRAIGKILKRTLLIFLIGLALNAFPFLTPDNTLRTDYSGLRIMGVLQRIGLCYGLAALIFLGSSLKQLALWTASLCLVYWALLWGFGGLEPYSLEQNVVLKVDRWILTEPHLWKGKGIPFDPEGLLSTISAVGSVLLGAITGKWLQVQRTVDEKIKWLFLSGALLILTGYGWGLLYPINKYLWTGSFVVVSAGWGLLVLALLLFFIDKKAWKTWSLPFQHFGSNPLIIFILSIVWVKVYLRIKLTDSEGNLVTAYSWIYKELFVPLAGPLHGSFLFALAHVVALWVLAWWLNKNKIFIKI
jgi:predicted acyltransferase